MNNMNKNKKFDDVIKWSKSYEENKKIENINFTSNIIIITIVIIISILIIWLLLTSYSKKKEIKIIDKMLDKKYEENIIKKNEGIEYRDADTGEIIEIDKLNPDEYEIINE